MLGKTITLGLLALFSIETGALATDIKVAGQGKTAVGTKVVEGNQPTLQDRIFRLQGEHPIGSLAKLLKEVSLHPKSADLYLQLGHAYFEDGDASNALSNYQKALATDPNCTQAHIGMSRTYFGIGNNKLGFAELQKAYTEGDRNVSTSALWESAYMHRELHQYDLALANRTGHQIRTCRKAKTSRSAV